MLLALNYGKAVQRVRIKRLLRENYKSIEENLKKGTSILISNKINKNKKKKKKKGYSLVFLIKKKCDLLNINFNSIKSDMKTIFEKANIIVKE